MPYNDGPDGAKITITNGKLDVPNHPIIPFIEGDGIGPDIWRASVRVFDAAVAKAYGGKRCVEWKEVLAGEKSFKQLNTWLPDETVEAFRTYYVGIKGPLTTPVGGGIRSLNVALRQLLDLYVCLRPVRWYKGVPSPVKHPEKVDMVIFRENTEDIYAGIEYVAGSPEAQKLLDFFAKEFPKEFRKIRFGNESAARTWQAQLESIGAPKRDVAVEVGIGLKPVSRLGTERLVHSALGYAINYVTGHAVFEATHGTAPKYANQDKVNPGSVILSGEMMFRHLGWTEAADLIVKGMDRAIAAKRVTYDFARLMDGATELTTSAFGDAIIQHM